MPLAAGTRLGPYEILGPLGAGGMGEVYRARDTRLDRTVAIKILPLHVAGRADLRQRFEREARAVSSLNHPHICSLYDVGHQDGVSFLVMEYLEGETLAARLAKSALPVADALRYAVQIADALEQAHRHGVFHRDLKPGNVMLTKSGAKLLDFGLAKLKEAPVGQGVSPAELPTRTVQPLTADGTIVGTLQYMAPEQLEGKEADARTDIFAFGALLYEMVTARRAFQGKTQASLISAIMTSEPPPLATLQPMSPPALEHVVKKCLAKDPDDRWQSIRDLADELKWIAEGGSQAGLPAPVVASRRSRERLGWMVAGIVLLSLIAALTLGVFRLPQAPAGERVVRFSVPPSQGLTWRNSDFPVVSPDGERIVFGGQTADGKNPLWVHRLNSYDAQPLPGTEGGYGPFWSPDSRSIAFFAGRQLKKIDLAGGPPETLCELPRTGAGGTWGRKGVIVFALSSQSPLYQVGAAGGQFKAVTALDQSRKETSHRYPCFLPDGRHFLYLAQGVNRGLGDVREDNAIYGGSLEGKQATRVLAASSNVAYAPSGHLLFAQGQTLMAQPFDAKDLRLTGDLFPIAEQLALVSWNVSGALFSVSENGVLCYRQGPTDLKQLTWFDRAGRRLGVVGEPGLYNSPALSPDARTVAVDRRDPLTNTRDIWLLDLTRGTSSRLTFDRADDFNALWSPDGSRIAFSSDRKGHRDLYQKLASGAGGDELLLESGVDKGADDWSRDGRFIVFSVMGEGVDPDVWALPIPLEKKAADRKPVPVVQSPGTQNQPRVSPDGRWLAYRSSESGRGEIYVQTFPPSGRKWQISTAGGSDTTWRGDAKELFYVAGNKLMAVEVKAGPSSLEAGAPRTLFEAPMVSEARRNRYVVTADGQRFLILTPLREAPGTISVVLNWTAGLKR